VKELNGYRTSAVGSAILSAVLFAAAVYYGFYIVADNVLLMSPSVLEIEIIESHRRLATWIACFFAATGFIFYGVSVHSRMRHQEAVTAKLLCDMQAAIREAHTSNPTNRPPKSDT
jgi:hypothetical protein